MPVAKELKVDPSVNIVKARYKWKYDGIVHKHLRMQGDRVYSYAFPLVDGHAVRICAALTAIDDHPKWRYQLVMTLESPVVAAGAGEGADEQQQWKVPAGRWTVTPKFYRINCLTTLEKPLAETQYVMVNSTFLKSNFSLVFDFSMDNKLVGNDPHPPPEAITAEVLAQKMSGLWKRGELTDAVLVASDGRELAAHRAVLGAHSQVFLTMFTIQMNERADGRVVFPDADSKVLGQMLEWMYKAKTPDLSDLDVALGLLVVAHRYQLEELQAYCEQAFPEPGVESMCHVLEIAQMHGTELLKSRLFAFTTAKIAAVMKTAGWAGLCRDHPELVGALIAHATGATADEDQQPKATTSKQLSTGTGNFFARVFRKK